MDYKEIIDKLVRELSYRVGIPNIENKEHQSIMSEILSEWGEYDVKQTIFEFLTEKDEKFNATNKKSGETVTFKSKEARDNAIEAGTHTELDKNDNATKTTQGSALKSKSYQKRVKKEKEVQKKIDNEDKQETTTSDLKNSPVSRSQTIDRGGDSKVKNQAFKYGFKEIVDKNGNVIFKPAPGNAGSLLNEVVSGETAQMLEENSDLTEEELIDILYERFGNEELFKSKGRNGNSGNKPAAGIKKSEGKNPGLHSKLMLAVRSGRRKHKKAVESAKKQGFKDSKMENYYGHSSSFDAMVNDIKGKQVIGPNGEEISQEEAEQLIRSGGGGDNPSDTATLVFDKDSNKVIMLFHSDKDSTEAIVAQSTANAEAEANDKNIDKLVEDGKLTEEQAEAVKGQNRELVDTINEIEKELKQVVSAPGKWFQENVKPKDAINSIMNDENPNGSKDSNATSTKWKSVVNGRGELNSRLRKYLPDGVNHKNVTEEQALDAFFKFMADGNKEEEPTGDQVTLMERLNSRFVEKGAPDIFSELEDVRNRTLEAQRDFTRNNDDIKIDLYGKEVGLGTFLEGGTIWKQFHLEAANPNSEVGVHKYPGMFETNHAGLAVDGETLTKCMGGDVKDKNSFVTSLEVGDIEEQKGVSGTQKGKTTGGKRIVYAITAGGKKIEIGQKTMRTKSGKTGKLSTDYKWSKDMRECFAKEGKK